KRPVGPGRRRAGRGRGPAGGRRRAAGAPPRRRAGARRGLRPARAGPALRGRLPEAPRLRVALLSRGALPLHPPGGLERAVFHLAKHLRGQGVETVLFTRPATREGSFPGEVVTVEYGRSDAAHGRILDRTLNYPRFSRRLGEAVAERVRKGAVDVVHAQGLTALGYG